MSLSTASAQSEHEQADNPEHTMHAAKLKQKRRAASIDYALRLLRFRQQSGRGGVRPLLRASLMLI